VTINGVQTDDLDLFDTNTVRDYTLRTTTTHRPVFLVTLFPTAVVPPLLLPDSLPSDGSGIVASLHGPCLAMVVSLAPLFLLSDLMLQYFDVDI
jgi:hypothetical protein